MYHALVDAPVLQVRLGDVRAQCECCRSTYFVSPEPSDDITDASALICAVCETVTTYAALILGIADEGLKAARDRLRAGTEQSATPWPFSFSCPNGHFVVQHGWDKGKLRAALKRGEPIPLYCARCDCLWEATPSQRGSLEFSVVKAI